MRFLISLLLSLSLCVGLNAKSGISLYNDVFYEHVVLMASETAFCTVVKVSKTEFLTAHHCLVPNEDQRLYDSYRLPYQFEVEKDNPSFDLTLVKASIPTKTPIKLAEKVETGDEVMAIGYIFTLGQISPLFLQGHVVAVNEALVAVDFPYRQGMSGGPLINKKGELVGINDRVDVSHDIGLSLSLSLVHYFLSDEAQ